ncbi:uncharacterized protein LOC113212138 isoform X2 [Frankliniella occidentalis]|uniref:Uncharacterized protein LOC113212138 isoform X2 n=1 Tax=Frankliniella occidentalis TaxID=133901 RepID=A0A9C6XQG8_FRAOC|nr:uncharacterized protein LOC113212138 isoform X2 [Frankliniella occidentalis]
MILLLGILASLVSQPHCQRINPIAGPFRIIPDHIEHCPAEVFKKELATWSFRGTRDRRNLDVWYYSGNYTLGFNFTDLYHGKYRLDNAKADLSTSNKLPALFYGKWRLDFKIVNGNWDCVSCMRIFLAIVPLVDHGSHFGAGGGVQDAHSTIAPKP